MKPINVYWSGDVDFSFTNNWNILYNEPQSLLKEMHDKADRETKSDTFLKCSAFKSFSKNVFVIRNPLSSSYEIINGTDVVSKKSSSMLADIVREGTLKNNIILRYWMPHIFFSEEPVMMQFTSPYFHETPHTKYGRVVPGRFDISSWIRPVHTEINLWENVNHFEIDEDEPLAYVTFETDRKVKLIKFNNSEKINRVVQSCANGGYWEPSIPLSKRYQRFKSSKMNKYVLEEIKKNIIE